MITRFWFDSRVSHGRLKVKLVQLDFPYRKQEAQDTISQSGKMVTMFKKEGVTIRTSSYWVLLHTRIAIIIFYDSTSIHKCQQLINSLKVWFKSMVTNRVLEAFQVDCENVGKMITLRPHDTCKL